MASLGQELKRAREERGLSLREIADSTHIGVRFLQAIESDTYDILPGAVYNRDFVRKFARKVGVDEEQAIKMYEQQLQEMGGEPERVSYLGLDDLEAKSSSGNGLLLSLVAIIILGAAAYLAYGIFKGQESSPEQVGLAAATPTATPVPVATADPNASPSPDASPTPTPTPEAAGPLQFQLVATTEDCWVGFRVDDGQSGEASLKPGETRDLSVNEKIVLNIGKLSALKLTVNGRVVNFGKLLPEQKGVVARNVVITKENYQQFLD
ncbi:MAG: helix-turn-helix domain-containing protein [Acidobacteria bacterium]|nr:helix-turn-helix domain-containing protein [Acidobacteriota bacterium]